jgi:hypothetical protein
MKRPPMAVWFMTYQNVWQTKLDLHTNISQKCNHWEKSHLKMLFPDCVTPENLQQE